MSKKSLIYGAMVPVLAMAFFAGSALADNKVNIDVDNNSTNTITTHQSQNQSQSQGSGSSSSSQSQNQSQSSHNSINQSSDTNVDVKFTDGGNGDGNHDGNGGGDKNNDGKNYHYDKNGKRIAYVAGSNRLPATGSSMVVLAGLAIIAFLAAFVGVKKYSSVRAK